jgi:predicted transcriptional regulator
MTSSQRKTMLDQVHEELHDICQPLTGLQCRLELATMLATEEAFRDAVHGGLEETRRMFDTVARIRQTLLDSSEL